MSFIFGMEPLHVVAYAGAAALCIALLWSAIFRRILGDTPMIPQVPPQYNLSPILLMSVTELSRRLRAGEITSHQIVSAYVRHIRNVNPYVNAIVFDRCELALEEALEADVLLKRIISGKAKPSEDPGWLLGIPCTIKESMQVVGCPNTSGHPHRKNIVATEDSAVVKRLRAKGAIILGVTNTSELCMWYESYNNVYGHSRNPYDVRCLVGGSSGGEGCSLGSMFAPFGLGADIGGSIRMPSFFNGIFGHKASTRLVPNKGQFPSVRGSGHFLMTTGPMCRHAEDLLPLFHTMAEGGYGEDPVAFPSPPLPPTELLNLRAVAFKRSSGKDADADPSTVANASASSLTEYFSPTTSDDVTLFPKESGPSANAEGTTASSSGRSSTSNSHAGRSSALATPYSFSRQLAAPIKPANRLKVFVIEDLGLFGHSVAPSQINAINECAHRLARELHADVCVLNFKDQSRCTGPIPRGWLAMRSALDMWSSLMSQPGVEHTFSQLMCHERHVNPWAEAVRWVCGRSDHTMPSISLMLIEYLEDRFLPSSMRQGHRDMAAQLIADIEAVIGDNGVIITPTFPAPAPRHHRPLYTNPLQFQYTALFNSLQMPTTAVPLWDPMAIGKRAPGPLDARRMHVRPESRGDFHLPRGVQVSAKWGNDILALSVAAELEKMFGGYKPPHWAFFAPTIEAAEEAAAGAAL